MLWSRTLGKALHMTRTNTPNDPENCPKSKIDIELIIYPRQDRLRGRLCTACCAVGRWVAGWSVIGLTTEAPATSSKPASRALGRGVAAC